MRRFFNILAITIILAASILPVGCHAPATVDSNLKKAAIVDQLYLREPNPELITEATRILESYGFEVDVWQGSDITVDFYRSLPSLGYKFILLRVHSGLLLEDGKPVFNTMFLFTAELYSTNKYIGDQLTDKVSYAAMDNDSPYVFAVSSDFIKSADGEFNNTIVLMMGCESFKYDDMPAAFIEKGASVYVGWNDVVSLEYVDMVTLSLLEHLCTANMTLSQSISLTMEEMGADPYFGSYLRYYPLESGDNTLAELIQGY